MNKPWEGRDDAHQDGLDTSTRQTQLDLAREGRHSFIGNPQQAIPRKTNVETRIKVIDHHVIPHPCMVGIQALTKGTHGLQGLPDV